MTLVGHSPLPEMPDISAQSGEQCEVRNQDLQALCPLSLGKQSKHSFMDFLQIRQLNVVSARYSLQQ